jgi:uncharacterized membrane protein YkvA (DUF1232 family)
VIRLDSILARPILANLPDRADVQKSGFLDFWKKQARALKIQALALYYAYRDPRTPWYARIFTGLIVAYAFSPIDLIPDFIPVLGYLDDLLIVPLGVLLALKMIPAEVMAECRSRAEQALDEGKPQFRFMAVLIVAVWIVVLLAVGYWLFKLSKFKL